MLSEDSELSLDSEELDSDEIELSDDSLDCEFELSELVSDDIFSSTNIVNVTLPSLGCIADITPLKTPSFVEIFKYVSDLYIDHKRAS